jgi:hypothetical protein
MKYQSKIVGEFKILYPKAVESIKPKKFKGIKNIAIFNAIKTTFNIINTDKNDRPHFIDFFIHKSIPQI